MFKRLFNAFLVLGICVTALSSCDDELEEKSSKEVIESSSIVKTTTTTKLQTITSTKKTTTYKEIEYPIGEEIFINGVAKNFSSNKSFIINADNKNWTINCQSLYYFNKLHNLIDNKKVKVICKVTGKSTVSFISVEINNKTYNIKDFQKPVSTKKSSTTISTKPQSVETLPPATIIEYQKEVEETSPPEPVVDNSSEIAYYRSLINDLNDEISDLNTNIRNEKSLISDCEIELNRCKSYLSAARSELSKANNTRVRYYTGSGWSYGTDATAVSSAKSSVNYWNGFIEEYENLIESSNNNISDWESQINDRKSKIQEYQSYIYSLQ